MTYNIQERCEHYNTTIDSCDCPARVYHPERPCKHMNHVVEGFLSFLDPPLVITITSTPPARHIPLFPPTPPPLRRSIAAPLLNPIHFISWEEERAIDSLYWECDGCGHFIADCTCSQQRKRPRLEEPSEESFKKMKKEQCSICLEQHDKKLSCTTQCGHHFHKDCINQWTNRYSTCPLCRTQLTPVQ